MNKIDNGWYKALKFLSRLTTKEVNKLKKNEIKYYRLKVPEDVENALRNIIRKVLGETSVWWNSRTALGVRDVVKLEIQRYPYDGANRKDELEYTHLGHLKEIIIFGKNWSDFKPHLHEQDKVKFGVIIDKAIPSRNSIGHCIPLEKDDRTEVEVRFRDILKMIK